MFFDKPTVAVAQILAAKDWMNKALERLTAAYQLAQKAPLFAGKSRTYEPFVDALEEQLPAVVEPVQLSVHALLAEMLGGFSDASEWHLSREFANLEARASVEVGGTVLLEDAPVPALLALEKQLVNLAAALKALPTLDPAHRWSWDAQNGYWASELAESLRTRKLPRVLVKAEATDKHPAQVEVYNEDTPVGKYSDQLFASKLTPAQRRTLLGQLERLTVAVKDAQQRANGTRVAPVRRTDALVAYLVAPFADDDTFPVAW